MADWSKWGVDDTYTNIPTQDDGKDQDSVRLNDTRATPATNLPTYAKRWNNTLAVFQAWVSSAWGTLVLAIGGGGTGATTASGARTNLGVYSTTQVDSAIDTDVATHAALSAAGTHGSDSAWPSGASKIIVRDSSGRAQVNTPSAYYDIATKGYVDNINPEGTYTPTFYYDSGVTNAVATGTWQYSAAGDTVQVTGRVFVYTSAAGAFNLGISLPIPSNFTANGDCVGLGNNQADYYGGTVVVNTTNDRATYWGKQDGTAKHHFVMFTYQVK